MNTSNKRNQIRAYFFPLKRPTKPEDSSPQIMISLGLLVFVIGCGLFLGVDTSGFGLGCVASLMLIIGAVMVVSGIQDSSKKESEKTKYEEALQKYNKRLNRWGLTEADLKNIPTGQQIDAWLEEDLESITDDALTHKLGLIRDQLKREPLVIYGPLFWETYGIPDEELVYVKETPSNILRFSCYHVVVVFLTDVRVATYSCNFNFLRNARLGEKVVEYLYQDIVSVSTEEISTNYTLPDGKTLQRAKVFRLTVPGDRIEVVVNSPQLKDMLDGTLNLGEPDQNVRVIREMLRSKKG